MPEADLKYSEKINLRIAWTTVESPQEADQLATAIMDSRLAACVQIDGPIQSLFQWKGKLESSKEIRLWIKYPKDSEEALQDLIKKAHPYEVPQWVAVDAVSVMDSYGEWAASMTSSQ